MDLFHRQQRLSARYSEPSILAIWWLASWRIVDGLDRNFQLITEHAHIWNFGERNTTTGQCFFVVRNGGYLQCFNATQILDNFIYKMRVGTARHLRKIEMSWLTCWIPTRWRFKFAGHRLVRSKEVWYDVERFIAVFRNNTSRKKLRKYHVCARTWWVIASLNTPDMSTFIPRKYPKTIAFIGIKCNY